MAEISVQVCYAQAGQEWLRWLVVEEGAALGAAIMASGLLQAFPEIDLAKARVGIYGKLKSLDTPLRASDRIEVYRPLTADPKEARRRRAGKRKAISANVP